MNSQSRNRLLQALRNVPNRHTYTATPVLPFRARGTSASLSQPFSSKACVSSLLPAAEDIHISKKRRYSSRAAPRFRHDDARWVERDGRYDPSGTPAPQRDDTPTIRRGDRDDQDGGGGGGIIVTSDRQNFRDRQGRPWTKDRSSTDQAVGPGAGTRAIGVGVGIGTSLPAKNKKSRTELRDLSVKPKKKKLEPWQAQKGALEKKFGDEGWKPRKKLSPDAMDGIRALYEEDSERWSTPVLAEHFKVSPEAIRRILKSKWKPKNDEEAQERKQRWARRHDRIWDHQAELGLRPKREKDRDVEDPDAFDEELRAKEMLNMARKA
ncbi:hypothetical protein G647_00317 [Cladophialophora carrionii CBS 160.54]|uniref:Required for respiratory growth protein 9, mitochondrial n=1 Tax=Cladophialophora carrionii CBS 160.54 TaxID=1279043 RepID=V9DNJ7_9EURO|nr:uncharacterized protein G647_00317 [Cladophialophora carrionii CBS 160.54]ETI27868.1 hypothetical protein G647_00317 [Cladophialophora carrionii CBS 160.54]